MNRNDGPESGVLLIVSGSVAAANAPGLCHVLRVRLGLPVAVVLTESARRFVTRDALIGLGGAAEVHDSDELIEGRAAHIRLAEATRAVLIYPASAGFLAKLAHGFALDLASTVVLACTGKPVLVVPSMHPSMWANPLVRRNVRTLEEAGFALSAVDAGLAPSVSDTVERFAAVVQSGGDNVQDQEGFQHRRRNRRSGVRGGV